jgi:hypothetical protein
MTSKDLMTFGKHKGKALGDVDRSYFDWLMKQDGFADKNKDLARWIKDGDAAAAPIEQSNNEEETDLFRRAPEAFRHWWTIAYGDRCRKQAAHNYIPFMRVALEAWLHATGIQLAAKSNPPATTPSETSLLRSSLPPSTPAKAEDYLTSNVPF